MSERDSHYFLTLLRHGESAGNADGIWQGHLNTPLTETGRLQANALADRWRRENKHFDAIFASPLSRALDTAAIIAENLALPLETDAVFMERDSGELSGKARPEKTDAPLTDHVYEPIGRTGESEMDVFLRGALAVEKVLQRPAGSYLIVSHGGLLNRMVSSALGIAPQARQAGARFAFGNTGFASLEFRPKQSLWLVNGINDQLHLRNDRLPVWQG